LTLEQRRVGVSCDAVADQALFAWAHASPKMEH